MIENTLRSSVQVLTHGQALNPKEAIRLDTVIDIYIIFCYFLIFYGLNVPWIIWENNCLSLTNVSHSSSLQYNKCSACRSIPDEGLCDPNHSGDSTLVALRLENNYIDPQKISPTAFSCVRSSSSVVIKPQKTKWPESTHKNQKTVYTPETQVSRQIFWFLNCQEKSKHTLNIFPTH